MRDGSIVTNDIKMCPTYLERRQKSKKSSLVGTEFLNEQMLQESRQ